MKLLQQLLSLSWFGRSRSKANGNSKDVSSPKPDLNDSASSTSIAARRQLPPVPSIVTVADAGCKGVDDDRWPANPDASASLTSDAGCWSPPANRICWGSPVARRSARVDFTPVAVLGGEVPLPTPDVAVKPSLLPRSRSLIRTNPWLPPSSPPPVDRRPLARGRRRSPSPSSCPSTQASTPTDSPAEPSRRRRMTEGSASDGSASGSVVPGVTTAASEGYCSISSLCTMSDCTAPSLGAASDDMQMSVDSLVSLFPTTMTASSTSCPSGVANSASEVFADSVSDSGIVLATSTKSESDPTSIIEEQRPIAVEKDSLWRPTDDIDRSPSDGGTPTNERQSPTKADVSRQLSDVQTVLDARRCDIDANFVDVLPFGSPCLSEARRSKSEGEEVDALPFGPGWSSQVHCRQWRPESADAASVGSVSPTSARGVDEISSSLASSVERLRRGRVAVDGAFGRAMIEERRRERELARLRRRVVEAQRDVLLNTLRDLRHEIDGQCRRLQAAYDAVLAARWPRLHADTVYSIAAAP